MLRALLEGDGASFEGEFYSTHGIVLEPRPVQRPRPPLWVASWGAPSGLRLVAHHGDGWIASAYNTTPDLFGAGLGRIFDELRLTGRTPESFTNAIATAWLYITENTQRADRVLTDILAPMLKRPAEALRALSLPIGPAELCAERLSHFASSGAQRIFLWPLGDELAQLELFRARVAPAVVVDRPASDERWTMLDSDPAPVAARQQVADPGSAMGLVGRTLSGLDEPGFVAKTTAWTRSRRSSF